MKKKRLLTVVGSVCLILVLAALLLPACAKEVAPTPMVPTPVAPTPVTPPPPPWEASLPDMLKITSYEVGATGYVVAAGIAGALTEKYGVKVRNLPVGTDIGRLTPLRTGEADLSFSGDGAYFSFEGDYEFAAPEWGPQKVSLLFGIPGETTSVVAGDLGVKTPYDMKGLRVAFIIGAPANNVKMEAVLAFGNLTWDDVIKVECASYAASWAGILEGRIDTTDTVCTSAHCYKLEASPRGIAWPVMDPNDKEGWARYQAIAPWVSPGLVTVGAGIPEEGIWLGMRRYPMGYIFTDHWTEDKAYAVTRAIFETYDMYKDIHPTLALMTPEVSGTHLATLPYHPGAVKYFKEVGVWTAEMDAINDAMLARSEKLAQAWETVLDEAAAQGIKSKDFPDYWLKRKAELVGPP